MGKQYANDEPVTPPIGAHCGKCQFDAPADSELASGFRECWKEALGWSDADFAAGTVLDLYNCRKKQSLIDQGIYKLSQVQKDDLGDFDEEPGPDGLSIKQRQWMQVAGLPEADRDRGYYLNTTLVRNAMAGWRFPLPFHRFRNRGGRPTLPCRDAAVPVGCFSVLSSRHGREWRDPACRPVPVCGTGRLSELRFRPCANAGARW